MDEIFWLILKLAACFFLVNGAIIGTVFTIHLAIIFLSLIYRNGNDFLQVVKNREELAKPLPYFPEDNHDASKYRETLYHE